MSSMPGAPSSGTGAWGTSAGGGGDGGGGGGEVAKLRETVEMPRIEVVHVDGLAILKIIKHCSEALPSMVAGSLLGLDQNGVLEVTHSFPLPSSGGREGGDSAAGAAGGEGEQGGGGSTVDGHDYQMEMMKMMREVNVDNNCVGWYQSMYLGSFCTQTLIDNQFSYQANLSDNSVVILYDPVQTQRGELTIKAYRLSKDFMKIYGSKHNEVVRPSEVLDEIPIKIRNPGIISALLLDLNPKSGLSTSAAAFDCDFERLDLGTNAYVEKNLEFLCSWIDDLANEQWKFQNYMRTVQKQKHDQQRWTEKRKRTNEERRAVGEPPLPEDDQPFDQRKIDEPKRMESLLISTQISAYCNQLNRFTGSSFEKLFLVGSLQRSSDAQQQQQQVQAS